jgi:hypothetical protein
MAESGNKGSAVGADGRADVSKLGGGRSPVRSSDGAVELRPWSPSDARFMAEASRDPAIERYNGPAPASVADAVAVVERLATRAVKLMTGWLLELGAGRVFLTIQSENAASSAVARRAGFSFEGTLRADGVRQGQRQDVDVFAVLPGEWSLEGSA